MPPARQPKRPGELELGSPDAQAKIKLTKVERGAVANDFSSAVKSKLQSYTRTGQACDRCKIRKIRCDALPEGCSHCLSQNIECRVTDRVTGRTDRRGYTQQLEREKTDMLDHIRELERLLQSTGIEVKPFIYRGEPPETPVAGSQWTQAGKSLQVPGQGTIDNIDSAVSIAAEAASDGAFGHSQSPIPRRRTRNLESRPADVHLGVRPDQAFLSSIRGLRLSILGRDIELGAIDAPDADEPPPNAGQQPYTPLYNKSVQSLLQSAARVNRVVPVELPSRSDAFRLCESFFDFINPYLPVVHRPTFMSLLARIYDDTAFSPSVGEQVIVHAILANMLLQYSQRNQENPAQAAHLNRQSNQHFHFGMSKFFELITSRTMVDLQALALLGFHTRAFPKPDCAAMLCSYCLGMAVELGLHLKVKPPEGGGTNLAHEMRKRVFWAITSMTVGLLGRMGRPMPIRCEDIDIEYPEMIADEHLTSGGVDTSRPATVPYQAGLSTCKVAAMLVEIYARLYCTRRDSSDYPSFVAAMEAQLVRWQDELPDALKLEKLKEADVHQGRNFALTCHLLVLEVRLTLRHPTVAMTNDPKIQADNTTICEEVSKSMLDTVWDLHQIRCVDACFYQQAVYIAAMFSTLSAHWERRHDATLEEIQGLREDMDRWLAIIDDACQTIGAGKALHRSIDDIVNLTIEWIKRDRQLKISSSLLSKISHDVPHQSTRTSSLSSGTNSMASASRPTGQSDGPCSPDPTTTQVRQGYYQAPPPPPANDTASYAHMSYTDPYSASTAQYAMCAHAPEQQQPDMAAIYSQAVQHPAGATPWHMWTGIVVDNSQDRQGVVGGAALGRPPASEGMQVDGGGGQGRGDGRGGAMSASPADNWPFHLMAPGGGGVVPNPHQYGAGSGQ